MQTVETKTSIPNSTNAVLGAVILDEREKDIQTLCNAVLSVSIVNTGDSSSGGMCPFCYKDCRWDANDVSEIEHESYCAVLIAKDLSTGLL
jgi:hypothetical protein